MFDDYFRRVKDRLFAPLARALGPGVPPNALTWVALVMGAASAMAALTGHRWLALAGWVLNRVFDGLDGTQARVHGRGTLYGAYLDIVLDFGVYAAIPAALAYASGAHDVLVSAVWLLGAFYVNSASWMYLAALLEQRRHGARERGELTAVTMPRGLIAGTETVVAYTLFLVFPSQLTLLFRVTAALVLGNVVIRLWWARTELRR